MFSSQSGFSRVPCPFMAECKTPHCVFLHTSRERPNAGPSTLQATSEVAGGEQAMTNFPRKRQRSEDDDGKHMDVLTEGEGLDNGGIQKKQKLNRSPAPQQHRSDAQRKGKGISSAPVRQMPPSPPPPPRRDTSKVETRPEPSLKATYDFFAPNPKLMEASENLQVEKLTPRYLEHPPAQPTRRHQLLGLLHEEFVRLNRESKKLTTKAVIFSDQQLITMALDVELFFATDKPTIYDPQMKKKYAVYKKMSVADWQKERRVEIEAKASGGSKALEASQASEGVETSNGLPNKPPPAEDEKLYSTGLSSYHELLLLSRLYADFDKIPEDGHVRSVPTEEMVKEAKDGLEAADYWELCQRCGKRFQLFPGRRQEDGVLTTGGNCKFHWGKRQGKTRDDQQYTCCREAVGISDGCVENPHHTIKISNASRLASISQFEETPENPELEAKLGKEVLRPVCIDGEMAFTVYGMELVRFTATSWPSGSELLDILVRPIGEVLDMNSRFSGVWAQQLANTKPWTESDQGNGADLRVVSSPVEARSLLFRLLTPRTPIVGHGLENDFNALRIIHPVVIDSSILFPTPKGLPQRYPLKVLVKNHLGRNIQPAAHNENPVAPTITTDENGKVTVKSNGGHDSKEDANAAGDMVRYALAKEWGNMRRAGWSWRNPSPTSSLSNSTSSESSSASNTILTSFEQHFTPPRTIVPKSALDYKLGLFPAKDFQDSHGSRAPPTVQTPSRDHRNGSGSANVPGGDRGRGAGRGRGRGRGRGESHLERTTRVHTDRRGTHEEHEYDNREISRSQNERRREQANQLSPEEVERLARSMNRSSEGRSTRSYNDLSYDGANDAREEEFGVYETS